MATESDGAVVVASERFASPDGRPVVPIIRKSDGGYGYGVTDARRAQHFAMVFDARSGPPAVPARM